PAQEESAAGVRSQLPSDALRNPQPCTSCAGVLLHFLIARHLDLAHEPEGRPQSLRDGRQAAIGFRLARRVTHETLHAPILQRMEADNAKPPPRSEPVDGSIECTL